MPAARRPASRRATAPAVPPTSSRPTEPPAAPRPAAAPPRAPDALRPPKPKPEPEPEPRRRLPLAGLAFAVAVLVGAIAGGAFWFGVIDDGDGIGGVDTVGVGGPGGDRDGGRSSSDQGGSNGAGTDGRGASGADGTGRDGTGRNGTDRSGTGGTGTGTDRGDGANRGSDTGTASGASGSDQDDHFEVVTSEELTPFLLRGSDLPAGWRTIDVQPSNADPDSCLAGIDLDLAGGSQSAIVSFQQGSSGPTLTNAVTNYPRTETAAQAIDALRSAFDACEGHASSPGSPSIRPAPVASTTADEAVAALITIDGQPLGRFIYARVGPRVTFVLAVGPAAASDGLADDAIEVVVTRLRAG